MTKELRDATIIAAGGTVKRPLKDIFGDIINVKSFGAAGDGATDDTDAIQAALIEAFGGLGGYPDTHTVDNRFANKPVYFPTGVYRVTKTLHEASVDNGLVFGDGPEASVIVYDGPLGTVMPTFTATRTGAAVTSITIGTQGTGWPPGAHYFLSFSETGVSDRAKAHVIVDEDGKITQGSIQINYGGSYSVTPTVEMFAYTPLFRTNGLRHSVMERIGFDMPAPTLVNSYTVCVMLDRWKLINNGGNVHQDSFYNVATKNATHGWYLGFSGDTGPQGGGTSTSSVSIGTGAKTFSSAYTFGGPIVSVRLRYTAVSDPTKWVEGLITSISGSGPYTITINVDKTSGTGTISNWTFQNTEYIGFNAMGSEMVFVDCDCTDHDTSGIYLGGQNVLSINVYGGVFTRIGNAVRAAASSNNSIAGGAALNNERGGSFAVVDGCTFVESRGCDYYGEGSTGLVFQNITSINTQPDNGSFSHGPFLGRFPHPCVMRNVRHTNADHGAGQLIWWLYEFGTIIEFCSFGHGKAKDAAGEFMPVYSRASTYLNSDPFTRSAGFPQEES